MKRRTRRSPIRRALLAGAVVVGCTSSADPDGRHGGRLSEDAAAGSDARDDLPYAEVIAGGHCTPSGTSCGRSSDPRVQCCSVWGQRYDEALGCRAPEREFVGCGASEAGLEEPAECDGGPLLSCYVREASGQREVVYSPLTWPPAFSAAHGWRECAPAEAATVVGSSTCDGV